MLAAELEQPHATLQKHGCKVVGIDILEKMIEKANEKTKKKA